MEEEVPSFWGMMSLLKRTQANTCRVFSDSGPTTSTLPILIHLISTLVCEVEILIFSCLQMKLTHRKVKSLQGYTAGI
jgi:hypothetical protein